MTICAVTFRTSLAMGNLPPAQNHCSIYRFIFYIHRQRQVTVFHPAHVTGPVLAHAAAWRAAQRRWQSGPEWQPGWALPRCCAGRWAGWGWLHVQQPPFRLRHCSQPLYRKP